MDKSIVGLHAQKKVVSWEHFSCEIVFILLISQKLLHLSIYYLKGIFLPSLSLNCLNVNLWTFVSFLKYPTHCMANVQWLSKYLWLSEYVYTRFTPHVQVKLEIGRTTLQFLRMRRLMLFTTRKYTEQIWNWTSSCSLSVQRFELFLLVRCDSGNKYNVLCSSEIILFPQNRILYSQTNILRGRNVI